MDCGEYPEKRIIKMFSRYLANKKPAFLQVGNTTWLE
jgi:hypothetical protein